MQPQANTAKNPLSSEPLGRLMVRFSIPTIISLLVNAIYNMVDQVFLGHGIGMLGIAATNIALPLTPLCTAISLMLAIGGASNFNLRLGAGKRESAGDIAGNALMLMVIIGSLTGALVLLFLRPLLYFFGATDVVYPLAAIYTALIAPGIPFLIFSGGAVFLIRADGSPNYAMLCMLSGAVFNLVFDPIFIFVFHWGIAGIALATTLGQILSSALALRYFMKRFKTVPLTRKNLRIRFEHARAICTLGAAAFINQSAISLVQIVLNNTLRHYGGLSAYGSEIPLAAVGAISKLNIIFTSLCMGISQGCQPIISFNYGARNYARVRRTFFNAARAATVIATTAFLLYQFFPGRLMTIFGEDSPKYLQFAVRYLRIYMFMTFANGIQPITFNFFSSIGKAKRGILIGLTRQVLFLMPLIALLPMFLGIEGLMYAGPVSDAAAAVLSISLVLYEMRGMPASAPEFSAA